MQICIKQLRGFDGAIDQRTVVHLAVGNFGVLNVDIVNGTINDIGLDNLLGASDSAVLQDSDRSLFGHCLYSVWRNGCSVMSECCLMRGTVMGTQNGEAGGGTLKVTFEMVLCFAVLPSTMNF